MAEINPVDMHTSYFIQSIERERSLIQHVATYTIMETEQMMDNANKLEEPIIRREVAILKNLFTQMYASLDHLKKMLCLEDWIETDKESEKNEEEIEAPDSATETELFCPEAVTKTQVDAELSSSDPSISKADK